MELHLEKISRGYARKTHISSNAICECEQYVNSNLLQKLCNNCIKYQSRKTDKTKNVYPHVWSTIYSYNFREIRSSNSRVDRAYLWTAKLAYLVKYLRIYFTDFRILFTTWKCFGCRWSICIPYFPICISII